MRIALLSTLPSGTGPDGPRGAFASFAGATVIERQLDFAIELGCERVACLTDEIGREVARLQHRAEQAGLAFRALRRPSRLTEMVTASDELLVIAAALLPDDRVAKDALQKQAVLVLPADIAVPLGYERIDLEFAWAGLMLIPGRAVAGLKDLPDDVDTVSALLRIALQNGANMTPIGRAVLLKGQWHLDADRTTLDERENRWMDAQREEITFRAPGLAVAERSGLKLARDVVGQSAQSVPAFAAFAAFGGAIGAGLFGWPASGIVLLALAALFGHIAQVVDRVANRVSEPTGKRRLAAGMEWLLDPVFVVLAAMASPEELGALRLFAPLMLVGLLHLGERHASLAWRKTYADRIALWFLIAPFAFAGLAYQTIALLALVLLATRFVPAFRSE